VHVYGNTFLTGDFPVDKQNPVAGNYPIIQFTPYSPGMTQYGTQDTNVQVFDNIIGTYPNGIARHAISMTADSPGFSADHNLYSMPNVPGAAFMDRAKTSMTLAAWSTATGNDVHSQVGDPKFALGPFTGFGNENPGTPASQDACVAEATTLVTHLQLASGSPAIDAGTEEGPALYYDFVGTVRPQDGSGDGTKQTDMGAFEFVSP
jgi:hypothetical protein